MIKIKVPATSANLGPGFDVLGVAFTMYNMFGFERSDHFEMVDFQGRYSNPHHNLVCSSYKKAFDYLKMNAYPVKIYMLDQEVPTSRGLGSSATCIVAGVLAAKYFLKDKLSYDECFQIATAIEGHPDNIAPAMFGGLIASYKANDIYKPVRYDVSADLKFNLLVPNFELQTSKARAVLPKELSYADITHNASRVANIPFAFSKGDLGMIVDLLDDKAHEPYRMPLIKDSLEIKKLAHSKGYAFAISGAGPTLLVISKEDIGNTFDSFKDFKVYKLTIAHDGAIIE